MSSFGVRGENYIFQVKFFDGYGDPVGVETPDIDIYTFSPGGFKISLEQGQMSEDPSEVGRWTYPYFIPNDYYHQSQLYGLVKARDPNDGTYFTYEIEVAVLLRQTDGTGEILLLQPPDYLSHWNTDDGTNGDQSVLITVNPIATGRIPEPSGGHGNPFKSGLLARTNQTITTSWQAVFETPDRTTGFGNDSTMLVEIFDLDSQLQSFTTDPLIGNGVYASPTGNIKVHITGFGLDDDGRERYAAKAMVETDVSALLPNGGFYYVKITHNVDTATDEGSYTYIMDQIFIDINPSTPNIGAISFAETTALTKYLSGLEYYDLNSSWTIHLENIDGLNANAIKTIENLTIFSDGYNLQTFKQSPFGLGSALFSDWSYFENVDDVSYLKTDWSLTTPNYRSITDNAGVGAFVSDPWDDGVTISISRQSVLIDTYGITATDLFEPFNDESRRQDATFNNGNPTGNWDSTLSLVLGEAMVQDSKMMIPTTAPFTNWTSFLPSGNPDYSNLWHPANYYRTFVDTTGSNQPNFVMVLTGEFVVDPTDDLTNNLIEIYIRRVGSPIGDFGISANPLSLHGAEYNISFFDDGVTNGNIRLGSSSGDTINGTFGGMVCTGGVYCHIVINDSRIKIDSVAITFPN